MTDSGEKEHLIERGDCGHACCRGGVHVSKQTVAVLSHGPDTLHSVPRQFGGMLEGDPNACAFCGDDLGMETPS